MIKKNRRIRHEDNVLMRKLFVCHKKLSKRIRDSLILSLTVVGAISTVLSIWGVSLADWKNSTIFMRIGAVFLAVVFIFVVIYIVLDKIFKNQIEIKIQKTQVLIKRGDVFNENGWKVISCDSHFDTRVDDVVIAHKSLQGKFVMKYGKSEIDEIVEAEAKRLHIEKDEDGLYDFPLGTIIPYKSSVDNQSYLLLAMTKLNAINESHTNMAEYEQMLMRMWKEIDRTYAMEDIVLPIVGAGITRFDDGPKSKGNLIRCMLCTLNSSGVSFNAKVSILIFGDVNDISLYEYKELYNGI